MQTGVSIYSQLPSLFLEEQLPRKLAQAGIRVTSRTPLDYLRNAFGKILASKLLHCEGSRFLQLQSEDRLAELAMSYVRTMRLSGLWRLLGSKPRSCSASARLPWDTAAPQRVHFEVHQSRVRRHLEQARGRADRGIHLQSASVNVLGGAVALRGPSC